MAKRNKTSTLSESEIQIIAARIKEAVGYWQDLAIAYEKKLMAILLLNTGTKFHQRKKRPLDLVTIAEALWLYSLLYKPKEIEEKLGISRGMQRAYLTSKGDGSQIENYLASLSE